MSIAPRIAVTRIARSLAGSLLIGALLAGALAPALSAQSQLEQPPAEDGPHQPHPEALEAIDRVKSPFCPGFMLEVCPSPYAAALRDTLDMMARQGVDSDSLVEWTLARYGDTLRALPEKRGRSLVAWIVPPLAVVLGIATVVVVLRRIRRPREGPPPEDVSPEERERLDEALRELEAEEETAF
jgi:cytochrome c-type biogenesis protein CcmH